MGNKGSRGGSGAESGPALPKTMAAKLSGFGFSEAELQALYFVFSSMIASKQAGDFLSLSEFQTALGFKQKSSLFLERVFKIMDSDNDSKLTFPEFVTGIAAFSPLQSEIKVKFAFKVFTGPTGENISHADLKLLLSSILKENNIEMTSSQIDEMVTQTFESYDKDGDGFINFREFSDMCSTKPSILKHLTINIAEMIGN
jgi:Ca2+-binding EF-hand superfamily protein